MMRSALNCLGEVPSTPGDQGGGVALSDAPWRKATFCASRCCRSGGDRSAVTLLLPERRALGWASMRFLW